MLRRMFSAAVVMLVVVGFVAADTVRGLITAASDKEVTITVRKKGEKKGESKTFAVSKDTKFSKSAGKKKKVDSSLSDLQAAIEKSKGGKGVFGSVDADGKSAKEVTFSGGRGGKKKKKDS